MPDDDLLSCVGDPVHAIGIHRSFGDREVLASLDLCIRAGEFCALLGRSGSGKTTLLRVLGGLDRDYEGYLHAPRRKAVVFQEPRLIPWQRVLPNVVVGLRSVAGGRRGLTTRGLSALDEVGLAHLADAWPVTLSGGEAQRASLARALVRDPQLLLLDEPFAALDALTRMRMHHLLRDLCERYRPAVLLVTHDVDEAIQLADRILVLSDGRISLDTSVELDRPRTASSLAFTEIRTRLLAELGVTADAGAA